ncbi:MAG: aldolase catalytic domain-containing protein [Clostridiales bacterium]|nr:aldolase catalytic domain-containing protein [Clostridiales bacterium]
MRNISLLDCTLRDGGWINDFRFGREGMNDLVSAVEEAGIEYVELGYIDALKGSTEDRSMYADFETLTNSFPNGRTKDTVRVVMIDYGKFDVGQLPDLSSGQSNVIDGIRICFHKKDATRAIPLGQQVLEKGYKLFFQPMVTTRYTDKEFGELIERTQGELKGLSGIYVVDSFGVMNEEEMCRRISFADSVLDPEIKLGIHTHNNLNKSFSNIKAILSMLFGSESLARTRSLIIDGSLSGMGKGAGNLPIEMIAEYLNDTFGCQYGVDRLEEISNRLIRPIREKNPWGSSPEYVLAAKYRVTPTYAKTFMKRGFTLQQLDTLLSGIPDEKKDSFDRSFADNYLKDRI